MENQNLNNENQSLNKTDNEKKEYSRTTQKFVARFFGGGIVALVIGIFSVNFLLILLGIIFTGAGIFMAIKNKNRIRWK